MNLMGSVSSSYRTSEGVMDKEWITANKIHRISLEVVKPECNINTLIVNLFNSIGHAELILDEVKHNTNSCKDLKNNLINRNTVNLELLILSKDLSTIAEFLPGKFNSHGNFSVMKEYCDKLNKHSLEMILKCDYANERLILLGARLDQTSLLSKLPKDIINLFVKTLLEVKFNDADIAGKAINLSIV